MDQVEESLAGEANIHGETNSLGPLSRHWQGDFMNIQHDHGASKNLLTQMRDNSVMNSSNFPVTVHEPEVFILDKEDDFICGILFDGAIRDDTQGPELLNASKNYSMAHYPQRHAYPYKRGWYTLLYQEQLKAYDFERTEEMMIWDANLQR